MLARRYGKQNCRVIDARLKLAEHGAGGNGSLRKPGPN